MTRLLQDLLSRSVERDAERSAVVMGDERLTYGELESESNRLARALVDAGCARGDRVCLLLPKSPAAIVGMLASLKAGAAYVPIDVESPASRVARIVQACDPRVTLACAETVTLLNALVSDGAPVGLVGRVDDGGDDDGGALFERQSWEQQSSEPLSRSGDPGDLAHLLFTSGSTGLPKGVTITHSNVMAFVEWATRFFGTASGDRVSGHPPLHFDLSTFDIYGTFLAGAELHLVPASMNPQPTALASFIRDRELTQWFSVPSALTFMVTNGAIEQGDFPSLQRLLWCGEVLPTPVLIELMTLLPHVTFTNLYGPTEATIASSFFQVETPPADPAAPIPIGEPCAGETLAVLDDNLHPVAPGDIGEIYIGGVGLSPGYWRDEGKTSAAFRPDPERAEERLYRTGDLGRVGEGGLLYILGRTDSQIKSRGYRIELGEIEAALNPQPEIGECAVIGVDTGGFEGTTICCAYSVRDDVAVTESELRRRLADMLPAYMVPARWAAMDALPKNLNGKTDRPALREHFAASAVGEADVSGPASADRPTESTSNGTSEAELRDLVRIETAALLAVDPEAVDLERAFKDLGFDSLAAVELRNRLVDKTGLRLPRTLAFDHPSPLAVIKALAEMLDEAPRHKAVSVVSSVGSEEPVAVVGMSCCLPGGVGSAEEFWELVVSGGDAISGFPEDRGWALDQLFDPDPDQPGTSYVRAGGFLDDVAGFDAGFFGIGPREALAMDPQQRLLLEGAWEALEDAGIDPAGLRGSQTGVFAGVISLFTPEYALQRPGFEDLDGYLGTGSAGSVATGRVAYTLGLEGPAVSVDTACSSSLVALHLACQALRGGECELALAGGVTVLGTPSLFVEFSRQRALSPDGRCKPFADAADGTGWAEGMGLVVLERLSDAQRNGHPIVGLIPGSAINQDGASNGLTAPNGPSQERVIRQALARAGLSAGDVDAVEAHGTGTELGDPIEAQALLATYGSDRPVDRPLRLGSVKSNIGHTQAAAGVAGVIKMLMAMRHGVLPQTLHVDAPSSHVDWSAGGVELLTEPVEWLRENRPRRAGVSSFGISGTNAHLIVEEPPAALEPEASEPSGGDGAPAAWVLSAKGDLALREHARRIAAFVAEHPEAGVGDIASTLLSRSRFAHGAVVIGDDRVALTDGLEALAAGRPAAGVVEGVTGPAGGVAVLFSGQGSQRPGMGIGLYKAFPVFAEALDDACSCLSDRVGLELKSVVFGERQALLDRTEITQPALFAVEVALYRLLESAGIRPDYVMGHSIGELVAAHVAGVLTLEDACELVAARGRLMGALPAGGAMVAIQASEQEVIEGGLPDGVTIAAINGPASVVTSGDEQAVLALADRWRAQGRKTNQLKVSHAFHSPRMDDILDELAAVARTVTHHTPRVPIVSNLTGRALTIDDLTPDYWTRHAREAVRLADSITYLNQQGVTRYIEAGPDAVLAPLVADNLDTQTNNNPLIIPLLRTGRHEPTTTLTALARAHTHGLDIDWTALTPTTATTHLPLPTYPFQHDHYWLQPASAGDTAGAGVPLAGHPLLTTAIPLATGSGTMFTSRLSRGRVRWAADHSVSGMPVLPSATLVELVLAAGGRVGCDAIEQLALEQPLMLDDAADLDLQVFVGEADERGLRSVEVYSLPVGVGDEAGGAWARNVVATVTGLPAVAPAWKSEWPPANAAPVALDAVYDHLSTAGLDYGPAFQGLRAAWRRGDEVLAEVALPDELTTEAERYALHPALLDAALHVSLAALDLDGGSPQLPSTWGGLRLWARGATTLRVRVTPSAQGWSVVAANSDGALVLEVDAVVARSVDTARLALPPATAQRSLFGIDWEPLDAGPDRPADLAVIGAPEELFGHSGQSAADDGNAADRSGALAAARFADLEAFVAGLDRDVVGAEVVVAFCGWSPRSGDVPGRVREVLGGVASLLQGWLADERLADVRLVVVTRGGVGAGAGDELDPVTGSVWGLVRSAQAEHPGRFVLADLDAESGWESLVGALGGDEPQVAVRGGAALVPRLGRVEAGGLGERLVVDPQRAVLITGGTGALGVVVARHLARDHGARRLVLVSRRGPEAEGMAELSRELGQLGCDVKVVACDVTDRDEVVRLVGSISADDGLGAVVHAAGVLDDAVIERLTAEQLDRVLAPKVDAAWHLHEATAGLDLGGFVLFSSSAATLGNPGQGSYAAANAFLDCLAAHRHATGLPALSLAWGPWDQSDGMTGRLDKIHRARLESLGLEPLPSKRALELFDAATSTGRAVAIPVQLVLGTLRAQARDGSLPPLFRALAPSGRRASNGSLAGRLAELPDHERDAMLVETVRTHAAAVLGHSDIDKIHVGTAFKDLGFDSLAAVELRNRLGKATGLQLSSTLVFDHPTTAAVARYLNDEMAGASAPASVPVVVSSAELEEPVAIVGMSCRLPGGVGSAEEFWELVMSGGDAISAFPEDRGWALDRLFDPDPDKPGTSYARAGGFLDDVAGFDAGFFGIGPREALAMDPQQRLLLEGAWEALEDAGIDPAGLRGSQTGVFAGVISLFTPEYALQRPGFEDLDGYLGTGSAGSVVTGRVAYTLGLEGPAVSVDTACSSSLVALHLACQALRGGECELALAGGVTVLGTPSVFVEFSRQRALSPDGRCKPFADAADGTGWAEGMGLLVLERLSDAQRNGHPIVGLISGSAINQDGASNGLTAPNGPSQERVIRQALARAGLSAGDVDAVEAHGTGTRLGDPIEAKALLATYGSDRPVDRPLRLGSVKSNIGHTQAAAGVAGVIKMVLAMRHGILPRTLNVDKPSSHVDWSAGAVELLTDPVEWPHEGRPRRAGVSSFGVSGTNAHVILEEAPAIEMTASAGRPLARPDADAGSVPAAWILSAKSNLALRDQARRLGTFLAGRPQAEVGNVAATLLRRSRFDHRAVVFGDDRKALADGLEALAAGRPAAGVVEGVTGPAGGVAVLFSGQGSQRPRMGKGLYKAFPVFADTFDKVCTVFDDCLGDELKPVVFGEDRGLLDRTEITQPALFAVEVALYRLLESAGIRPDYVMGHSIGELVAAHVAGVLTLEDACELVAARGRLMGALPAGGAMVAIQASEQEVIEGGLPDGVTIAAINGPASVVTSGDEQAVLALADRWRAQGRKTNQLKVSHAFHSPRMDDILDEFAAVARTVTHHPARVPIVSNVTGMSMSDDEFSPDYWTRHAREAVRFADSITYLNQCGVTRFIEAGPDAVLSAIARDSLDTADPILLTSLLRTDRHEPNTVLTALAYLDTHGLDIDWAALTPPASAQYLPLPAYAFQHDRYWLGPVAQSDDPTTLGQEVSSHPLLGAAVTLAGHDRWVFTGQISPLRERWLADHMVSGTVVLPGAAVADLALTAGTDAGCDRVDELTLEEPIVLSDDGIGIQIAVGELDQEGRRSFELFSRSDRELPWRRHAGGTLAASCADDGPVSSRVGGEAWPPPDADPVDVDSLYELFGRDGLDYGPAFQGLRAAWCRGDEVFAEVALPEDIAAEAERYAIHPALLDAALHTVAIARGSSSDGTPLVPFAWRDLLVVQRGVRALRVRLVADPDPTAGAELTLTDEFGALVAHVSSLVSREMSIPAMRAVDRGLAESLFDLRWTAISNGVQQPTVAVVGAAPAAVNSDFADVAGFVAAIDAGAVAPEVVVAFCSSPGDGDLPGKARDVLNGALSLVQAWLADERLSASRLVLVTRSAVAVKQGEDLDLAAASLWGLVRSAQVEHPDRFVLADLDADSGWEFLVTALAGEEPQIAVRAGVTLVPRLARAEVDGLGESTIIDSQGAVLITGGTGALGAVLARHLVKAHGARRLVLASRQGPEAEGAAALRRELTEMGCDVGIVACDVANRDEVVRLVTSISSDGGLGAVIHAAGVLDDALVETLTSEHFDHVLASKLDAAWYLHEATAGLDLRAFLLFSSSAATFGNPGQGNYAAANAFLDALAAHRHARGLPALSLAWGPWEHAEGMAGRLNDIHRTRLSRFGLGALGEPQALRLFDAAITCGSSLAIVAPLDFSVLRAQARKGTLPALLRGLVRAPKRTADPLHGPSLEALLARQQPSEQSATVLELVRTHTASVLGHESSKTIDGSSAFKDIGFDSLAAVELRNRLGIATGLQLNSTLIFDFPTPDAVAQHLLTQVQDSGRRPLAIDAQLDELESTIALLSGADEARAAERLRMLTARLGAATGDGADLTDISEHLAAASDDQIFDFIDEQLSDR